MGRKLPDVISVVDIRERLQRHLARVQNLLEHFSSLNTAPGRPTMLKADLLRAAVLLLHATLEDLLRSSEEVRLLQAPDKAFERVRWLPPGVQGDAYERLSEKLTVAELAAYRGQTVNDVLLRAFQKHHERSNYNNEHDVVGSLTRMGLSKSPFEQHLTDLAAMMARRHRLAHRADLYPGHGLGKHAVAPIGRKLVEKWFNAVKSFGELLVAQL